MRSRFDAYYFPIPPFEFVEMFGSLPGETTSGLLSLHEQGLTDEDVPELVEYLNAHPEIKFVNLAQNQIGRNATLFLQCSHLVMLLLYQNQLTADEAVSLMMHPSLKTLGLGMNDLQGLTAAIIARVKETHEELTPEQALANFVSGLKLHFLDISYFLGIQDHIPDEVVQPERPFIQALGIYGNKLLTKLRVAGCPLGEPEARALAANQFFTYLGLTRTDLTDEALHHFAGNRQLTSLGLCANSITLNGLRDCLSMPKLTALEVSENNLGDAGAQEINRAIASGNCSLVRLEIASVGLTPQGMSMLLSIKQLQKLGIGNHMTMGLAEDIIPVILRADHLRELDVSGIPLEDSEIVPTLGTLDHLQRLDVSCCSLPVDSIRKLVSAINRREHSLKELNVSVNEFANEGAAVLARLKKVELLIAEDCNIDNAGAIVLANAADSFTGFRLERNLISLDGKRAFLNKVNLMELQLKESTRLHDVQNAEENNIENTDEQLALQQDVDVELPDLSVESEMDKRISELAPSNQQRQWIAKRVDEFQILLRIMALLGEQPRSIQLPTDIIKLIGFQLLKGLRSDNFITQTLHLLVDNYKKPQWKNQFSGKEGEVIHVFRKRPPTSITMFSLFETERVENGKIKDEPKRMYSI